ncbi:MAG: hydroxymethylbilane synthase [Rickettsiella sp.]|nr:hydroxymethylbilane synthase [Rickettsiella sp.]
MTRTHLRIATRKSPLAYWQAYTIKKQLEKHYPFLSIELLPLITEADRHLESALNKLGGKGLFVKELENALLSGQADIAVHSMKDVPMEIEKKLKIAAICEREDPRDVLISKSGETMQQLITNASIGTSSLRRQSQLMALRPDLKIQPLRGNVNTRLEKLACGNYDAIILAAAGLIRLERTACISEYLETNFFLPAPGQGALGIECRLDDEDTCSLITVLNHLPTYPCVMAERALSRELGGNCQVPIAAYADYLGGDQIRLRGLVATLNGNSIVKVEKYGRLEQAEELGITAAKELVAQGADKILKEFLI